MAIGLLTISAKIAFIQESVINFFQTFGVLQAVEILLLFGLFFFVSKVLRDNDATKLMLLYWFMILSGSILHVFDGELLNKQFLLLFVIIISAVMLVIFNVEVKKYFWDVHSSHVKSTEKTSGYFSIIFLTI